MNWFKRVLAPWKALDTQRKVNEVLQKQVYNLQWESKRLTDIIKAHAELNVDAGYRGPSTFIAIGRYRHHDHVEVFNMHDSDFTSLVSELKDRQRTARIGRVDAFPDFRANILRQL